MPIAWWGLVGLFIGLLINRAADCWLSPARLQCGLTRHPARQWLVLVGLPALFMVLAWRAGDVRDMAATCLMAAVLILIAIVDWEQRRVPNIIVLPATGLALAYAWQIEALLSAVAAAVVALVVFLVLYALGRRLFGPGALGMGDVKLAGLIGACFGLAWMPYALLLGIILAGAAAAVLLLAGRARRGELLPYGHYLAVAALIVLVAVA